MKNNNFHKVIKKLVIGIFCVVNFYCSNETKGKFESIKTVRIVGNITLGAPREFNDNILDSLSKVFKIVNGGHLLLDYSERNEPIEFRMDQYYYYNRLYKLDLSIDGSNNQHRDDKLLIEIFEKKFGESSIEIDSSEIATEISELLSNKMALDKFISNKIDISELLSNKNSQNKYEKRVYKTTRKWKASPIHTIEMYSEEAPLFSSGICRISYYHNSLFKMVQEADSINNVMDSTVINTL